MQALDDIYNEYIPTIVPELSNNSESESAESTDEEREATVTEPDPPLASIRSSQEESQSLQTYNDDDVMIKIRQQREDGCGCQNKCLSRFRNSEIFDHILQMRELKNEEKGM